MVGCINSTFLLIFARNDRIIDIFAFISHQEYRRRDIHLKFGGNPQGGICPSSRYPVIFIFTGETGDQHGYRDMWENENVFSYTGEGQSGDMVFSRGNLALRDHLKEGKRLFLFERTRKGYVRFISEMAFFDCDFFPTTDTSGNLRRGIKFFLRRIEVHLDYRLDQIGVSAEPVFNYLNPIVTERPGLVVSRVGQGAYRKSIINRWENRCAVTGFNDSRILVASHIHPWQSASDDERLDVSNGILLSPTYDALFDRHLVTFENSGKIVLSSSVAEDQYKKIGITGRERITRLSRENLFYLEKHQEMFKAIEE